MVLWFGTGTVTGADRSVRLHGIEPGYNVLEIMGFLSDGTCYSCWA